VPQTSLCPQTLRTHHTALTPDLIRSFGQISPWLCPQQSTARHCLPPWMMRGRAQRLEDKWESCTPKALSSLTELHR